MKEERCAPNSSSGSTQLRSAPLGFEYTGSYNNNYGSLDGVGLYGRYWSCTTYSGTDTYYLDLSSSGVVPQPNTYRGRGHAVRCVAKSLNFLRTGFYENANGNISFRITFGRLWSIIGNSVTSGRITNMSPFPTFVFPQNNSHHGDGLAIRCVVREG